jgi:hypothetical protein
MLPDGESFYVPKNGLMFYAQNNDLRVRSVLPARDGLLEMQSPTLDVAAVAYRQMARQTGSTFWDGFNDEGGIAKNIIALCRYKYNTPFGGGWAILKSRGCGCPTPYPRPKAGKKKILGC